MCLWNSKTVCNRWIRRRRSIDKAWKIGRTRKILQDDIGSIMSSYECDWTSSLTLTTPCSQLGAVIWNPAHFIFSSFLSNPWFFINYSFTRAADFSCLSTLLFFWLFNIGTLFVQLLLKLFLVYQNTRRELSSLKCYRVRRCRDKGVPNFDVKSAVTVKNAEPFS